MTGPYRTPSGVGSKDRSGPETSREAAETHAIGFREIRERAFEAIERAEDDGLTPDECAAILDLDELSVRPRLTELKTEGRIVPNGARRRNCRGNAMAVLVAARFAPPPPTSPTSQTPAPAESARPSGPGSTGDAGEDAGANDRGANDRRGGDIQGRLL